MRGVRVGEASHPGPAGSRCFALTEVDSDVEDEDSNSHISEVYPPERKGGVGLGFRSLGLGFRFSGFRV